MIKSTPNGTRVVYNIEWNLDKDDVLDAIEFYWECHEEVFEEMFGITPDEWEAMQSNDVDEFIDLHFGNLSDKLKLIKLPTRVVIPDDIADEDICDYLSDKYYFRVNNYDVSDEVY